MEQGSVLPGLGTEGRTVVRTEGVSSCWARPTRTLCELLGTEEMVTVLHAETKHHRHGTVSAEQHAHA